MYRPYDDSDDERRKLPPRLIMPPQPSELLPEDVTKLPQSTREQIYTLLRKRYSKGVRIFEFNEEYSKEYKCCIVQPRVRMNLMQIVHACQDLIDVGKDAKGRTILRPKPYEEIMQTWSLRKQDEEKLRMKIAEKLLNDGDTGVEFTPKIHEPSCLDVAPKFDVFIEPPIDATVENNLDDEPSRLTDDITPPPPSSVAACSDEQQSSYYAWPSNECRDESSCCPSKSSLAESSCLDKKGRGVPSPSCRVRQPIGKGRGRGFISDPAAQKIHSAIVAKKTPAGAILPPRFSMPPAAATATQFALRQRNDQSSSTTRCVYIVQPIYIPYAVVPCPAIGQPQPTFGPPIVQDHSALGWIPK